MDKSILYNTFNKMRLSKKEKMTEETTMTAVNFGFLSRGDALPPKKKNGTERGVFSKRRNFPQVQTANLPAAA
jgi:hypothetical protein